MLSLRVLVLCALGTLGSSSTALAMGIPAASKCKDTASTVTVLAASCTKGVCEGHRVFEYKEKDHELACSDQVMVGIEPLSLTDKRTAEQIMAALNQSSGSFVAEITSMGHGQCEAKGSQFCIDNLQIKIKEAVQNPESVLVANHLQNAEQRQADATFAADKAEIWLLLQAMLSSFVVLMLARLFITHESRRLIAGVLSLVYMSVFVYSYGMTAFFVRPESWPIINAGMLVIMFGSQMFALQGMFSDLKAGFKRALQISIFIAQGAFAAFLINSSSLDLVTLAYGLFYVATPVLLGSLVLACGIAAIGRSSIEDEIYEDSSFSFSA